MILSHSSHSYLISPLYKLILAIFLIVCIILITGLVPPEKFASAPQVKKSLYKTQVSRTEKVLSVKTPLIRQVAQLHIGEEKVVATPAPIARPQQEEKKAGSARQIDEYTWTIKVDADSQMASEQEVFAALNVYRQKRGQGTLSWDAGLASYARSRVDTFVSLGATDKHAGFTDFIQNQDGFSKVGFNSLGENSSFGYQLNGTNLIETVYAGDEPHDDNQLRSSWTHVGISVKGLATDLIFAGSKR